MTDSFEEALEWCKKFYEEDNSIDLAIGDYRDVVTIWSTEDILHEIGVISDKEYKEYLDSLDADDY